MPEDREPFVHQYAPPSSLHQQLAKSEFGIDLGRQVAELQRDGKHPQAVTMLKIIIEPPVYTIVSLLPGLSPSHQAVVADLMLALTDVRKRHRILHDLRALVEKYS